MKLVAGILALAGLVLTTSSSGLLCDYQGPKPYLLEAGNDADGYFVRISTSEETQQILRGRPDFRPWVTKGLLAPGINYWPQAELLANQAGAVVFGLGNPFTGGSWVARSVAPLPLRAVWRGPSPLSCLESFAHAAGLGVVVAEPRLWLVGPPPQLDRMALLVFTYPADPTLHPSEDTKADAEVMRAVVARLPIRTIEERFDPTVDAEGNEAERIIPTVIGIGTYWVPDEPGALIAVVSQGAFNNPTTGFPVLSVTAFKLHVTHNRDRVAVDCVWATGVDGPLIPRVDEDFDGDGVRDYFFQQAGDEDEQSDKIVSGADGSVTRVLGRSIAVERDGQGTKRFAVYLLREPGAREYEVLRYSTAQRRFAPAGSSVKAASPAGTPPHRFEDAGMELARVLGGGDKIRIYALPGGDPPMVAGAEYLRVGCSKVWKWFFNRAPAQTLEDLRSDLPMQVLYKVVTPGYLAERAREKQAGIP